MRISGMDWTKSLRCPRCKTGGVKIDPDPMDDALPHRGEAVCTLCGARYPIREYVLNMAERGDLSRLTMAGLSNHLPLLPWGYENIWRPRSLTLLTGEAFPVAREIALVNEWLAAKPHELIVDLGSSTDLYARGVAKRMLELGVDASAIVAIDMATGMLKVGRKIAQSEGITRIAHVRAPVEQLPFADGTVDALVCGGSLNEFRSMEAALREARRVCVRNGRMVAMTLIAAKSRLGKFAQSVAGTSGIKFLSLDKFNETLDAAGWRCEKQQAYGAVAFTFMRPAQRGPQ